MNDPKWTAVQEPEFQAPSPFGWALAVLRGVPLAVLVFGCLMLLLILRLIERPVFGSTRPWTPHITVFVCRNALRLMGLGYRVNGAPMRHNGILVANHTSWLDIFALNATGPLYFVAKAEVANWPGIGWLARATGTVFIARDRAQAQAQTRMFQDRLNASHKLLFFPEGTSTDGLQVLTFKTTLFAAFYGQDLTPDLYVQPISVVYHAPRGKETRYYGWWGDMDFGTNLIRTLAAARQGTVEIHYHAPLKVSDYPNRKALASAAEQRVRDGHTRMRTTAT